MSIAVELEEIILQSHSKLHSPFLQNEGVYLACENGEVLKVAEGDVKIEFKCNGQPNAVVIDQQKETFYVTDVANKSILAYTAGESSTNVLVRDYEGVNLVGPHSLCLSKKTGNIFFTDCGELAETSIQHPKGSVFLIDVEQQSLRPLSLRCLALPTGMALSQEERVLYVCETGRNRLLRYFESAEGIFYSSVFHVFTGRYGPTCIDLLDSKQMLFVGLYEFRALAKEAALAVLSTSGELLARLLLTSVGPELSGLSIAPFSGKGSVVSLYVTENSLGACHKIDVDYAKPEKEEEKAAALSQLDPFSK